MPVLPPAEWLGQEDGYKFKVSLDYIVSSGLARAVQYDPATKQQQRNSKTK